MKKLCSEDCDLRHCKRCGGHNYESGDVCDACLIEGYSNEAEAQARNFGGNYEEAAKFYGW